MAKAKKRTFKQQTETLPGLRLDAKTPKVEHRSSKPLESSSEAKSVSWQDEATIHRLIDFFKGF